MSSNKRKIFNDPVYGFINVESDLIFDLIEHPWFQRLRRIKQLGLTEFVYPGANHTRFHHAIGAMHLMGLALTNLRVKGFDISNEEYEAAQVAILLHDIGHGPFSHALEYALFDNINHEFLSLAIMEALNKQYHNQLELAIKIFKNDYHRPFFHQLISSQLDIDRLDYLKRDGFYTGVSEGTIGSDRIIKLITLHDDNLVIEEKGIYSIEHFLIARRVMYWQVYLHKTTVCAEQMLIKLIQRAQSIELPKKLTNNLHFLALQHTTKTQIIENPEKINTFLNLDDFDIWFAIKEFSKIDDPILAFLANSILNRKLLKITISDKPYRLNDYSGTIFEHNNLKINKFDNKFIHFSGKLSNEAYASGNDNINILLKSGKILPVQDASDLPNIKSMSKIVEKYYLCTPKSVYL